MQGAVGFSGFYRLILNIFLVDFKSGAIFIETLCWLPNKDFVEQRFQSAHGSLPMRAGCLGPEFPNRRAAGHWNKLPLKY